MASLQSWRVISFFLEHACQLTVVAPQYFYFPHCFGLCACMSAILFPIWHSVSVCSPSPPCLEELCTLCHLVLSATLIRSAMTWRMDFVWRGEVVLVPVQAHVSSPLFPSLVFVPFSSPVPPSSSPTTSGSPQEVQRSKMGWFFPPSYSLVALFISQINIEKTLNLTAEWLIQIIVAFSCIGLLFSLTLFFAFLLSPSTLWYLGHLWIRAFEWKGRKKKRVTSERERRQGSKTWVALQFSVLFLW